MRSYKTKMLLCIIAFFASLALFLFALLYYDDPRFPLVDTTLLCIASLLLLLIPAILLRFAFRFEKSLRMLRNFISSARRGLVDYDHLQLPRTELGDIGQDIVEQFRQLEISKQQTELERERLIRHFHYFEEGIAIFTAERRKIYANTRFIQYVNTLLDYPTADVEALWQHPAFASALDFLKEEKKQKHTLPEQTPIFRHVIDAGNSGQFFALQVLVYGDESIEMTISDITKTEKNKRLKQQMSNNIAHELRTPVSSIRGYIETLLMQDALPAGRQKYFLDKAHAQVVRLTDLIRDVSLITKVEEAPESMPREKLYIHDLVEDILEEFDEPLKELQMRAVNSIAKGITLSGNYALVYSIFRNLIENSIRYAGESTEIHLTCYNNDGEYFYFNVYDTGEGIPEEHLSRIFERFYRIGEGRTRDGGGTGLGLSIVRNAVHFHGGTISVRNHKDGGLEFLFTLACR